MRAARVLVNIATRAIRARPRNSKRNRDTQTTLAVIRSSHLLLISLNLSLQLLVLYVNPTVIIRNLSLLQTYYAEKLQEQMDYLKKDGGGDAEAERLWAKLKGRTGIES